MSDRVAPARALRLATRTRRCVGSAACLAAAAALSACSCTAGERRPGAAPDDPARAPESVSPVGAPAEGEPAAAPSEGIVTVGGGGGCGADLQRVATCFRASVTVLQAEPAEGESLGVFLGRAVGVADGPWHRSCDSLGLRPDATRLVLSDGSEVTLRRTLTSRDHFEGGREVVHFRYAFSAEGCDAEGETTIELSIGGSPRP